MDNFHEFIDTNPYLQAMHANAWMYDSYYDARSAAVTFLERLLNEYTGIANDLLSQLLNQFRIITDIMYKGWLDFPFPFWVDWKNNRIRIFGTNGPRYTEGITKWDTKMRKRASHTLKLIREEEKKAYALLERLVNFL
jgi:hypothetical protein